MKYNDITEMMYNELGKMKPETRDIYIRKYINPRVVKISELIKDLSNN